MNKYQSNWFTNLEVNCLKWVNYVYFNRQQIMALTTINTKHSTLDIWQTHCGIIISSWWNENKNIY